MVYDSRFVERFIKTAGFSVFFHNARENFLQKFSGGKLKRREKAAHSLLPRGFAQGRNETPGTAAGAPARGRVPKRSAGLFRFISFLCLSFAGVPACAQEAGIKSEVELEYGDPSYRSVSSGELRKSVELPERGMIMGMTVAKLRNLSSVELGEGANGCFPVTALKISLGYTFEILIDDRYKPGSCEYEAIAEHELGHVRIYREELEYYGKLIDDELLISSLNMTEVCSGGLDRRALRESAKTIVKDDERVNLLLARLDASVREKNEKYDSEEEYLRVKAECQNW
jgi:hypothetical protein